MKRLVQRLRNPWVLGIAAALALYALAGFLLVPYLVRHYVPKLAGEHLRCQAAVAEVRFNPFLFELEAKDFSFKEAAGEAIFGFQRLFVDFDLESLFRWAWTFADIRLEAWSADLVIDREGRLNLAKIAAALPESNEPSPPAENPPRLVLKHVALTGGSVKFTDRSKPTPVSETVSPIDVEFDTISTLPEHRGSHAVSAKLANGGMVEWKGHGSFYPILSEGEVRLEGFKLATPWNFVRDQLDLAEPLGDVSATARYRFRYGQAKADLSVNDVGVKLKGLRLSTPSASQPILALDTIEIAGARFDLASRELTVPTFNVQNGHMAVSVDEKGVANWETLVKTAATTDVPQPTPPAARTSAAAPEAPWRVKLEAFKVADIGITYADASHAVPSVVSVGAFKLGLGAEVESGAGAPKVRIRDLAASLERIAIAERDKSDSLATLDSIKVEGGQMDLEKREATIQQVALRNGGAKIARDVNQTIRWLELFGPRDQENVHPEIDIPETDNEEESNPWRLALKAFDLQGFHVALADQSISPEVAYDIEDMKVAVKDITNDEQTPIAFDVQLKIKQGGALSTAGQLSQKADRAEAEVKIEGMNLTPLKPLVAQVAALTLESAAVSANLRVDYSQATTGPALKAAGAFSLDKLLLKEAKSAKPFLSWKALSADGIDFGLGPDNISIKEMRLVEPDTKIVIFKDQTVNLAAAFQQQGAPSSGQPEKTAKQKSDPANPFPMTVERVRIERGTVDFADLSLVLPFAARIHELSGAVTGISSDPDNRTRLKLEGRVGEYGQVNVEGSLSPLQLEKFSDVKVAFRNVAMPPLSAYSGTFAGRKIESGKLNLDLQYNVEDRKLKSNNTIILEQFTLGERVESPKAVDLPLDLAIALLTDSEGKINASVPIEGNVGQPEFRVGHLVWEAIVNLITSAVTAPFKALGAIVGGDGEGFDAILFQPGIDKIPPPEREKLAKVAEGLTKRPKIALTVHGTYDPAADGEALRSMQVRRALAQKLDVDLQSDEDPGPVAVDNAETQRALEALSDERDGEDAIEAFEASYEKSAGKKPKRVSAILSLMGQASEDVGFYEKLLQHLIEKAPLATGDLEALAVRRATAVINDLSGQAGFDPSRATAGEIEQVPDTQAGGVPTKLEPGRSNAATDNAILGHRMSGRIIIVGAGHAAGQLVMSLRLDGFSGSITVIGEEPHVPYQRPPLSKQYLGGEVGLAKLYLRPDEWYRDAGIELILGTAVTGIDRAAKPIALSDGRTMEYAQLALTTGSRSRTLSMPGVDLPGVFYLRTIQDVDRIREHFVAGKRLAIIGGGYIGLEATAVAVKKGLVVTVLEMDTRVMSRVVAPIMSEFFEDVHRTAGVDVRTSVRVTGIARNEDGLAVCSNEGAIVVADVVIIGVGIVPNVELAAAAGLATDNGILVDEFGRTSDPCIVAAGDCTNHPSLIYGRRVRLESVQNAMSQARVAAGALHGKPKPYTDVPTFWSEQYDLRLQIVGLSQDYDDIVVRGDPGERAFALFYLKEDVLVAVDAINKPMEFMHCRRLVADRARVAPDQLKDPAVPVGDAVKL